MESANLGAEGARQRDAPAGAPLAFRGFDLLLKLNEKQTFFPIFLRDGWSPDDVLEFQSIAGRQSIGDVAQ